MKWTTFLLLLVFWGTDPSVSEINRLKKEARAAYLAGNYQLASTQYSYLTDSLGIEEDEINLNLAHSYFQLNDTTNAQNAYHRLSGSNNPTLKSIAYQQLGVMAKNKKELEKSLQFLKTALKVNPANEEARYNYEVVKKLLENRQQQKDQNQDKQDQDQKEKDQNQKDQKDQESDSKDKEGEQSKDQQKDQQEQKDQKKEGDQQKEEQGKEGEESEKQKQMQNTQKKLEEMNMSEEKAQMILEAMRNNEIQYIQQRQRRATERPDSGKPDW